MERTMFPSSHTLTPVRIDRCFCLAYSIKEHAGVPPAVTWKYIPKTCVSEKHRVHVETTEINGKNIDFNGV